MTQPEFDESVVKADKRSKVVALLVAVAAFLLVRELVVDVQFASIVAATAGIGTRLYIPYHASVRVPEADRMSISPAAGAYHHGAAGIGAVLLSVVAVAAFVFTQDLVTSVGVGIIASVGSYVVLSSALPPA